MRNVLIDSEITWKENDTNIDDIQEAVVKQKKKTGNITITDPKKENCTYTCAIKHQPKSDSIAIEIGIFFTFKLNFLRLNFKKERVRRILLKIDLKKNIPIGFGIFVLLLNEQTFKNSNFFDIKSI